MEKADLISKVILLQLPTVESVKLYVRSSLACCHQSPSLTPLVIEGYSLELQYDRPEIRLIFTSDIHIFYSFIRYRKFYVRMFAK